MSLVQGLVAATTARFRHWSGVIDLAEAGSDAQADRRGKPGIMTGFDGRLSHDTVALTFDPAGP